MIRTAPGALALCALALSSSAAIAKPATGTVSGTVVFAGTPPVRKKIVRDSDPVCAKTEGLSEDIVVGAKGGLQDVLVRVVGVPGKFPIPQTPVVIAQHDCRYEPRVSAVRAGQQLAIHNGDPTYHNVRGALGAKTIFNMSQPQGDPDITKDAAPKVGDAIALHCDVHAWMQAWAVTVDNPFFVVTGDDGAFRIADVPPGKYTLEAWHPTLGAMTAKITVPKRGAVKATKLTFKPAI
ncbi:MAG: TonB-dependent receptor [Deltaproteobacteria bacterium]|nr:TonB-dependent receptor [Deltaproteobacteria bacterium]